MHELPHGQAAIALDKRCKDKCFRVCVRWKQCRSSGYFNDNALDEIKEEIDACIKRIPRDGKPIIPFPKIGEGNSQMKWYAPKSYDYLMSEINKIKYQNIIYQ